MRRILITLGIAAAIAAGTFAPAGAEVDPCPDGGVFDGKICDMTWTGDEPPK